MELTKVTDWIQAAGSLAQVVVAIVAVYLAVNANRISRDSIFKERIVDELLKILVSARGVRNLYFRLFDPFVTTQEKEAARVAWIEQRERLTTDLGEISSAFSGIDNLVQSWGKIEDEEDSHVHTKHLEVGSAIAASDAKRRYDKVHQIFRSDVSRAIRKLRGLVDNE